MSLFTGDFNDALGHSCKFKIGEEFVSGKVMSYYYETKIYEVKYQDRYYKTTDIYDVSPDKI